MRIKGYMKCAVCSKKISGKAVEFPPFVGPAHPKCLVVALELSPDLPFRGVTHEIVRDPKFLEALEFISREEPRLKIQKEITHENGN